VAAIVRLTKAGFTFLALHIYTNITHVYITVASRPLGQVGPLPDLKYAKSGQIRTGQVRLGSYFRHVLVLYYLF